MASRPPPVQIALTLSESFIDPDALERSLAGLRDRVSRALLPGALHDAIDTTRALFSATGAGVMMVDESTVLCAVAATDEPARILEERQEQVGRGPCVEALTFDRTILVQDMTTDPRWPELAQDMAEVGVRAVLGVPIRLGGLPVGSLNVYSSQPGEWNHSQVAALEAYGGLLDGLLLASLLAQANEQLVHQLQRALDNRVIIERAVGVVMATNKVDAVTAFGHLRRQARSTQTRAAEVAAQLLAEVGGPHDGSVSGGVIN